MPELDQKKRILIIEDNKEIQSSLKLALTSEGFIVSTANNGKEGMEELEHMLSPCVIILDLMMPIMNGWEFLDKLNALNTFSKIPIIILSALADKSSSLKDSLGDKSLNLNIQEFFQKPIDLNSFLDSIHKNCA